MAAATPPDGASPPSASAGSSPPSPPAPPRASSAPPAPAASSVELSSVPPARASAADAALRARAERRRRWSWFAIAAAFGAGVYVAQHRGGGSGPAPGAGPDPAAAQSASIRIGRFVDSAEASGLRFVHENGARGRRFFPETMGAGVLLFDFDGDGDADVLLVQSGPLPVDAAAPSAAAGAPAPVPVSGPADSRLFRNDSGPAGLRFTDVTAAAGLAGNGAGGYGMGAYAADIDDDGDLDLYLTRLGPDRLYRNRGDGTFEDATAASGLGLEGWSTSACFIDLDQDGRVDLYVARYTDFAADCANDRPCVTAGHRSYCTPLDYRPLRDRLYRNVGGGRFEDWTERWGVLDDPTGYGLGVVAADLDDDGRPDLYVANDLGANRLYLNRIERSGDGALEEVGLEAGVAYGEDGRAQAGMGLAAADWDGDGRLDLVCTNYQGEVSNLYMNRSRGGLVTFIDEATGSRLGALSLRLLGFGVVALDLEPDGRLDLAVANGHVMDNVALWDETASFEQPLLLARGATLERGVPRFVEVDRAGAANAAACRVWRGLAAADLDGDGDLDLVATANAGPAALLLAEGPPEGAWLALRLEGTRSNRAAIGARVVVESAARRFTDEVRAGSSYLSQGDLALVFGFGDAPAEGVRIEVRWPSGLAQSFERVPPSRRYRLREGDTLRPDDARAAD